MAIIEIKVSVCTSGIESLIVDEIQFSVPDDFSNEQIEDAKNKHTKEWMFEQIEFGWSDV